MTPIRFEPAGSVSMGSVVHARALPRGGLQPPAKPPVAEPILSLRSSPSHSTGGETVHSDSAAWAQHLQQHAHMAVRAQANLDAYAVMALLHHA